MGKKGKKALAGKPKKLTPKDVGKRLDVLAKKLEEETKDVDLFAPPPPTEDCAVCLLPLSRRTPEVRYQACCGNEICKACFFENKESINKQKNAGKKVAFTCPFCREPEPTSGPEYLRQIQARCLKDDHNALRNLGGHYLKGDYDETPKDKLKALDYYIRAVELGSPEACGSIGIMCDEGIEVAANKERAALFDRVGALRGSLAARHNMGCSEYGFGNYEVAIRHWKISAEAGYQPSLDCLKEIFNAYGKKPGKKFISEEYLDFATLACHEAQLEVKSEERDKYSAQYVYRDQERTWY